MRAKAYDREWEFGAAGGQHGTIYGYRRAGCRCESCRKANTEYQRAYMKRRREAGSKEASSE